MNAMFVYLSYAKNMVSEGRDKEWIWLSQKNEQISSKIAATCIDANIKK
jgi:site-specific recombinase XerD